MNLKEKYTKDQMYAVLALSFLGFLFDGYDLLTYSFVLYSMSRSLNIDLVYFGMVESVTLVSTIMGAILLGIVADRFGRKKGLMLTIGIYSISTLLTAFSGNLTEIALFRAMAGFGIGGEWGIGFSLLNEVWHEKSKGFAGGILQSAFSTGAVLAIYVSTWALSTFPIQDGWRIVYITGGIPALMIAFIRMYVPETGSKKNDAVELKQQSTKRFAYLFSLILLLTFGEFFMAYASITWWPTVLQKIYGIEPAVYSNPLMFASLIQIPILFFVGFIADKFGRKGSALIFALLTIVSLIYWYYAMMSSKVYSGSIWIWPVMLGYLLFQATSLYVGVFGIWFGELFTKKIRSTASNFAYMFGRGVGGGLAASAVILYAGILGGLQFSMVYFMFIGAALSVIGILLLPETKIRD